MSEKNIKSFIDELIKEVEDELDEANVTGNVDGYDTPHAFSGKNSDKKRKRNAFGSRIAVAQQLSREFAPKRSTVEVPSCQSIRPAKLHLRLKT